jgi:hypothetical protein
LWRRACDARKRVRIERTNFPRRSGRGQKNFPRDFFAERRAAIPGDLRLWVRQKRGLGRAP